jgi:LacI family transcriptional regulator
MRANKVPTIYDVAKKAGVSTYTVSCVLNKSAYVSPALTKRVEAAVKELDYTPNAVARSLQTRSTKTIAMLIPDIGNPFYARVVRGVEDRLRRDGYSLILGNSYNDAAEQARYVNLFKSRQVDGLLLYIAPQGEANLAPLVAARRPVVLIGRTAKSFECDTVISDYARGVEEAIDHLVARGHQRIGLITGEASMSNSLATAEGWRRAMKKYGLKSSETMQEAGDWTEVSGCEAAHRLLGRRPAPTAIFVANFLMMTGVLRACKELKKKVPADVEVASSDDSDWLDVFSPPITTVVQPTYEIGERAADLVLARIGDSGRPVTQVILEPTLRVRQ